MNQCSTGLCDPGWSCYSRHQFIIYHAKKYCVRGCDELFSRSMLWSILNIISLLTFLLCILCTKFSILLVKFFSLEFGDLYILPTITCLPFFIVISIIVDSKFFSSKLVQSFLTLYDILLLINIPMPPPLEFVQSLCIRL